MIEKKQCNNCKSYDLIVDSRKKMLLHSALLISGALALFSIANKLNGFLFILNYLLIITGVVTAGFFLTSGIALYGKNYYCRKCKHAWKEKLN